MSRANFLTTTFFHLARIPFGITGRGQFSTPEKVLILQSCCISQVMLATPLLAAVSESFPKARIDWGVGDWARPAIAGNPRLTELIHIGEYGIQNPGRAEVGALVERLRAEDYDTCFVPSRSAVLSYVAWRAGIKQRIGLNVRGRGFAHKMAVRPPQEARNSAVNNLALATAVGISEEITARVGEEFYPSDGARLAVTQRLVEEIDWLGDVPLVVLHPGGGENPMRSSPDKRWPVERFALLGNHLIRQHKARVVLVGTQDERPLTRAVAGLMAAKVSDLSGQLSLSEVGALCEVADLYVGNDAGPTHIAAATGCPTLALYGPNDPVYSMPYTKKGKVIALWRDLSDVEEERPFTWDMGITAGQAIEAADTLLARTRNRENGFEFLMGEKR